MNAEGKGCKAEPGLYLVQVRLFVMPLQLLQRLELARAQHTRELGSIRKLKLGLGRQRRRWLRLDLGCNLLDWDNSLDPALH